MALTIPIKQTARAWLWRRLLENSIVEALLEEVERLEAVIAAKDKESATLLNSHVN